MKRIAILVILFVGLVLSSVAAESLLSSPKVLVLNGEIGGYTRVKRVDGVPILYTNLPGVTLEIEQQGDVQIAKIAGS